MSDETEGTPVPYEEPVAQLLAIGEPARGQWPDYPATYGLRRSDVPALAQMVQDEALNSAPTESDQVWAPVHAWRALGQLQAEEAIDGLLAALSSEDSEEEAFDDWMIEEMPEVLSMLGPAVLPALRVHLANPEHGLWSRVIASHAVAGIGSRHPAARDEAVAILANQLAHHDRQDPYLNASLVADLTDLEGVEAEAVMAKAFADGDVDLSVQGDWEEVQISLGLLDERISPVPAEGWIPELKEMVEMRARMREQEEARAELVKKLQRQQWGKVGRNEPCPCGSGRKYKQCHGRPG